ncbi:MAG: hypothetical protein M1114_06805 [Candidatus Dependentiae bacterium]|nr:hypothetical protein [Candidatus Dependentiae bacterium]
MDIRIVKFCFYSKEVATVDTRENMVNSRAVGYWHSIKASIASLLPAEKDEFLKLIYTSFCFFLIIGSYTLSKELKDIVFTEVVGKEYIWQAKMITILMLIPLVMIYSKFVDALRRYQLLAVYSFAYGAIGLLFAYLIGHQVVGLPNPVTSPYRLFGWLFYFFSESFSPFVVSVFWSFVNSINTPASAKKNYAPMVTWSKVGGMLTSGFAWALLSVTDVTSFWMVSHVGRLQILLALASLLLIVVPLVVYMLVRSVSKQHLHGYEAAYRVETQRGKKGKSHTGIISGLRLILRYPYVFGIFCVVLFFEVIQTVLAYQKICIAKEGAKNLSESSGFFFKIIFIMHFIGFFISLFGTRKLLERLGEKVCLLLVPISTALLFVYFKVSGTQFAFLAFFVILRSIHYAFSYPVRESLYVLTVKDVQFKSKSWIDAFGSKIAKSIGSAFNGVTASLSIAAFGAVQSVFFTMIIGLWVMVAYLLGKRFEKAVAHNEVIGVDESDGKIVN